MTSSGSCSPMRTTITCAGPQRWCAGRASMASRYHADDVEFTQAGKSAPFDQSMITGRVFNRIPYGGFEPVPVTVQLMDGDVIDGRAACPCITPRASRPATFHFGMRRRTC